MLRFDGAIGGTEQHLNLELVVKLSLDFDSNAVRPVPILRLIVGVRVVLVILGRGEAHERRQGQEPHRKRMNVLVSTRKYGGSQ